MGICATRLKARVAGPGRNEAATASSAGTAQANPWFTSDKTVRGSPEYPFLARQDTLREGALSVLYARRITGESLFLCLFCLHKTLKL